jgi:hypothetical protein
MCYKRTAKVKREENNEHKDLILDHSDNEYDIEVIYNKDWSEINDSLLDSIDKKDNLLIDELKNELINNTELHNTDKNISNITYDKFKELIQKNNITNLPDMTRFIKRNKISTNIPHIHFEHETKWICYSDLFNSNDIFTYDEAISFINTLEHLNTINTPKEWVTYYNECMMYGLSSTINIKLITDLIKIPHKPNKYYLSEWDKFENDTIAWEHFLKKKLNDNKPNIRTNLSNNTYNNLSNIINTDHRKKIKLIPRERQFFNNYITDLSKVKEFFNNKFDLECIIGNVEFNLDDNKNIYDFFIKIRFDILTNEIGLVTSDYPIIIYKNKFEYDNTLLDKNQFINKVRSGNKFKRSKKDSLGTIQIYIDNLYNEIIDEINRNK